MTNYNMAGNPNLWSMNNYNMHNNNIPQSQQPTSLFSSPYVSASSSLAFNPYADNHDLPQSWSQLLLGGLASDEEKLCLDNLYESKKLENWEDQTLNPSPRGVPFVDVKQEISQLRRSNHFYGHGGDEEFYASTQSANWSQTMPVSSPRSCVTSLSTNMLDFSHNKADGRTQQPDHSSECNSAATGGVCKKARVQSSSSQPPLKVRKEKLGDRITALHQIVSPFGKTDTASVLLEAIGYIRFLQGQIEALSSPYLGNASGNMRNQHSVHGERNCIFPEDPGQLLSDNCLKRRGEPNQGSKDDAPKDLRSRGLCLVPVSYTQHVGSDSGADYWAPAIGGGF